MLEWLSQYAAWFVLAQLCAFIALAVWVWRAQVSWRQRDVYRDQVLKRLDEQGVDGVLAKHERDIARLSTDAKELYAQTEALQHGLSLSMTHVSVLRFNPFGDDGGNQSFAIALLNEKGTGLVISSLHHRSGTRTYAKPVRGGTSEFPLSKEEQRVIHDAQHAPIRQSDPVRFTEKQDQAISSTHERVS